jgi:hypothetical protein
LTFEVTGPDLNPGKYIDVSRAAAAGPQPGKKNSEEDHPDGRLLPELIISLPAHSYRSTQETLLSKIWFSMINPVL